MSKDVTEKGIVKFRALLIANEHRNAYGLRYSDFSRYRNHCGNRTHRLRSTLKMTHGKGREFKKLPPITLENIKDGHLQLLLFEAERAWAYSQELYTASLHPSNKETEAKLRHSATGRFRRAIHWCTQLLSHCQSLFSAQRLSAKNMMEASAYTLILSGRFLRFRDEFEDALDQICVARHLLDLLANTADNSRDQALATLFADEISPEIRFCAHQLGNTKSYDIDSIVKEVAPKQRASLVESYDQLTNRLKIESQSGNSDEGRERLKELVWEGQPVPVRNPELVDALLRVQRAQELLQSSEDEAVKETIHPANGKEGKRHHKSRKGVAAFDAILAALSEAEEVARKLVETQKNTGVSVKSASNNRDIHFLHAFIVYRLLSKRIERDLTLVSALIASSNPQQKRPVKVSANTVSTAKPEQTDARLNPAVVKLLDTVLQSLVHMRSLSIVDESPELANAVEARLAYTKGRRCLSLARSYAAVKQYAQAIALLRKAHIYTREVSSLTSLGIGSSDNSFYPLTKQTISELESILQSEESHLAQEWFAYNGGQAKAERDTSKKPLFFDIALNYAQLDMEQLQRRAGLSRAVPAMRSVAEPKAAAPTAKAKMEEITRPETPEPPKEQAGGLSNLLGGWWGRR